MDPLVKKKKKIKPIKWDIEIHVSTKLKNKTCKFILKVTVTVHHFLECKKHFVIAVNGMRSYLH